jgi:hypothetical protein
MFKVIGSDMMSFRPKKSFLTKNTVVFMLLLVEFVVMDMVIDEFKEPTALGLIVISDWPGETVAEKTQLN